MRPGSGHGHLAQDRPARVTDLAVVTNHQGQVEWEPYAAAIRSAELVTMFQVRR